MGCRARTSHAAAGLQVTLGPRERIVALVPVSSLRSGAAARAFVAAYCTCALVNYVITRVGFNSLKRSESEHTSRWQTQSRNYLHSR